MRAFSLFAAAVVLASVPGYAADKYTGPRPPKPDIPYLLHADNLIETESGVAAQESRKDSSIAVINGAASPVRTPLSEPIFIIRTDKLQGERFELYKLEVRNGRREVVIGQKKERACRTLCTSRSLALMTAFTKSRWTSRLKMVSTHSPRRDRIRPSVSPSTDAGSSCYNPV